MGFLGKVAAYRWLSNGRSGGGGGGGAGLVILLAVIVGVVVVFWLIASILSFIWDGIYGVVHPVLATAPIITIPLSVLLLGSLFTLLEPYSYDTVTAYLDGDEDKLTYKARAVWVIASINTIFALVLTDFHQGNKSTLGAILAIAAVLFALYGFFEMVHTPYRCTRLLLNAPEGHKYVILFLAPILTLVISAVFNVNLPLPEINSRLLDIATGVITINATYILGPLAIHRNETAIRKGARKRMQSTGSRQATNANPETDE